MNEALFLFHILLVVALTLGAFKAGKETLVTLTALQAVLANFFVLKQIDLFGWTVTCSDIFAVGSILGLNLIQEHFSKELAKRTIWISFFAMVFFGLMSQIHLFYTPSQHDIFHVHYEKLLLPAPRLLIASLVSFFVVQLVDVGFFGVLKNKFTTLNWQWRNIGALIASQFLDTLLFSFLGLYGLIFSMVSTIVVSFVIKLLIIVSIALLSSFSKGLAKNEV